MVRYFLPAPTDSVGSIRNEIENDSTPVNVVLTGLEIFNKPILVEGHDSTRRDDFYLSKQIDKLDVWNSPIFQNFFSIRFAALVLTQRDKINYAYRLEGFDRDWVYVGTRRFASYTNLDPAPINSTSKPQTRTATGRRILNQSFWSYCRLFGGPVGL